ncbi:beta-ketoacyl synthase N-terminal-like domain-containing protein [Allokutzneria oryzae]|uniref:Beta-ketoacyl synthase N-terminal-like domain-containing protein n=1 Tax=Allokutzneria oryzae TaxID=1378989 RepID=A0ABV6A5W6_9PSEU
MDIAIVGRGCVLPGALTPDQYWDNLVAGRQSLSTVPRGRWGLGPQWAMATDTETVDRSYSDVGGYVHGFESVFDPSGFAIGADSVLTLDPLFQWVLHAGREALRESGRGTAPPRSGLVLGNLCMPPDGMAGFAEHVLLDSVPALRGERTRPDARNRFSAGLPAHIAAKALGLDAGSFALDAACASSLYAIKLACDRLLDGSADLMLAGAVNRADQLILQVNFAALSATSRTGQSRPFHRDSDGLVLGEGAGMVALMRLADAVRQDVPIFGVVRGVGLSNDGRTGGLLVPAQDGQERAMRQAYEVAGLAPETVSLVECHATGTPVGDSIEVRSLATVFAENPDLPIGSAKSNLGHVLAPAGIAGLLKVVGGMRAGVRPPTVGAERPITALDGTPIRLVTEAEEWTGPLRAGVSAFGFGGNNAHLVVDGWVENVGAVAPPVPPRRDEPVAIVAIGAKVADGADAEDFRRDVLTGHRRRTSRAEIDLTLAGLRFPPRDLERAYPQQLVVLETAREAVRDVTLPRERTLVLVGMGTDLTGTRYGARLRVPQWMEDAGADTTEIDAFREAFAGPYTAAVSVGAMPNLVANRINAQLDLAGPGYTVSAEEASGIVALDIAARALRVGEADAAIVGAVDLSGDPVHQAALRELGRETTPGDAAVVLVLKRLSDAERDGDRVIALLDESDTEPADLVVGDSGLSTVDFFGEAHAAVGLVGIAVAATALRHGALPRAGAPATPAVVRTAEVVVDPLEADRRRVRLRSFGTPEPWTAEDGPSLEVYSGRDRAEVLAALEAGRRSDDGPARLAVVVEGERGKAIERARRWLTDTGVKPAGVAYRDEPLTGEVAFVFTNGAAVYPSMGRELWLAFPDAVASASERFGSPLSLSDGQPASVIEDIVDLGKFSMLHKEITDSLGLRPSAVIGYSAGEPVGLTVMGVWPDITKWNNDFRENELLNDLTGDCRVLREQWRRAGIEEDRWASHLVNGPAAEVRAVLADHPGVHVMAENAPDVCVVGGPEQACAKLLARTGLPAIKIGYHFAAHVPELESVRAEWRDFATQPAREIPGVRFYSGATTESYTATSARAAEAVSAQGVSTVRFADVVERAWADGVRVFVELGPQGLCTSWIRRTLGDREHLAVALDAPDGRGLRQFGFALAELVAAGVPVRAAEFFDRLRRPRAVPGKTVRFPVLWNEVRLPELRSAPVSAPTSAPVPAPVSAPALTPGLVNLVMAQRERLAAAHAAVLAQHTETHRRFLDLQTRTTIALMGQPVVEAGKKLVFDRSDLLLLGAGPVSRVFGPRFAVQDNHRRHIRLPQPPMLLFDRVLEMDAEPASMGTGVIRTETDVHPDSWYLDHTGYLPPGLMVETGQGTLVLMSWLGADLGHPGDRNYRLLDAELTYLGSPARAGEVISCEVNVDGHSEYDGLIIFACRYDYWVGEELRVTVRSRSGLFTDEALASSPGVPWNPSDHVPAAGAPLDIPVNACAPRKFGPQEMLAFANGRAADCFGQPEMRSHTSSPRLGGERTWLLHEVTEFDPAGGPWGRGYLRVETPVADDAWFFDGHFRDDPCMPGNLIVDGGFQAMAFYLAALGFTVDRDGWRFEPVQRETYDWRCGKQITPANERLVYELFVAEVRGGDEPTLIADIVCAVDGVNAFHGSRFGLTLRRGDAG